MVSAIGDAVQLDDYPALFEGEQQQPKATSANVNNQEGNFESDGNDIDISSHGK